MVRRLLSIPILAASMTAVLLLVPGGPAGAIPDLPTGTPTAEPTPSKSASPKPSKSASPTPSRTRPPREEPRKERRDEPRERDRKADDAAGDRKAEDRAPMLPPEVARGLAVWEGRQDERTASRTTERLLELLERAHGSEDVSPDVQRRGFGRFPVVGRVWYMDDWAAPRYVPYFHLHEGTDLFAPAGTAVIATIDGVIAKLGSGGSGGTAVWLLGSDGVRYYYGHLRSFTKGLVVGQPVKMGDVIGEVGDSGNAKGTPPHVHFEVNPGGRGTVNPKPYLDAWLGDAEARALTAVRQATERATLTRYGAARWDLLAEAMDDDYAAPLAVWAAGLDGSGAAFAFADMTLRDLLPALDWDALSATPATLGASASEPAFPSRLDVFSPVAHDDDHGAE